MKQLDTDTVLEIIRMIDVRCAQLKKMHSEGEIDVEHFANGEYELQLLNEHLQSYIEGLVNQVENQTEQ